jgi:hypothetical protein
LSSRLAHLFDHLVGAREQQHRRHVETERLRAVLRLMIAPRAGTVHHIICGRSRRRRSTHVRCGNVLGTKSEPDNPAWDALQQRNAINQADRPW